MSRFWDITTSLPTVIFTVALGASLVYLVVATVLGLDDDSADIDGDGADALLGIEGIPLSFGLALLALFAWFTSVVLSAVTDGLDGAAQALVAVAIFVGAIVAAALFVRVVARPLRSLLRPTPAPTRADLVGRMCRVTTGRVTDSFGQAEVRDGEGGSLVVQVRCPEENTLTHGDAALIYEVDEEGRYLVTADPGIH